MNARTVLRSQAGIFAGSGVCDRKTVLNNSPHAAVLTLAFAAIVLGYFLMATQFPVAYIWATYEDLVGEWTQTFFFLAAGLLSGAAALRTGRYRWFFALLTVACSYVFLEEISWGQRIFGFDTPEYLKARNLQGEANLHNLFTGPHKTLLKDAISIALALGLAGYGLIYPVLLRLRWAPARWLDRLGVAAPPLVLWPFFTTAALLELQPFSFNEAEIAELLVAMALSMVALQYLVADSRGVVPPRFSMTRNDSLVLGGWVIVTACTVIVAAGVTTIAFYSVPDNQVRVDNRIENGVEKFAGRYVRYDRCDIALGLYDKLLRKEPDRVFILRKKASCQRTLGDLDAFEETIARAIDIDREKFDRDPWRASVNQSLVRSYRLAGDSVNADAHLAKALEIGVGRILEHSDSASAAYSYGRTLQLAGQAEAAFEQFERAHLMKPTSSRYRRAYYSARAALKRESGSDPVTAIPDAGDAQASH